MMTMTRNLSETAFTIIRGRTSTITEPYECILMLYDVRALILYHHLLSLFLIVVVILVQLSPEQQDMWLWKENY